jgi:c-di-GMP-binding flagellar brake protein YcgR|tara:strand:+ start:633 stop:839 length:207 start_codon:yes stop_codon:yes gene_type:complete
MNQTNDTERRKWPRYQISLNTTIKCKGNKINHASAKNISFGGLVCLLSEKLGIGEEAEISMELADVSS